MTDPRPVLVTGASGFAGTHLLDHLATSQARRIVAWSRRGGRAGARFAIRSTDVPVEWTAVDILDRASVRQELERTRPAVVFHLAGAAHVGDSWNRTVETLEANVLGAHYLLDALEQVARPVRVVLPSSAVVYRSVADPLKEDSPTGPSSPYAVSKLAQEMVGRDAGRADGLDVLIARAFNHTGAGHDPSYAAPSFARQIALIEAGRLPPLISVGNLDARRDLTDVRDVVRAYAALADRGEPGRIYNVCSGRAYSIGDLLGRLRALAHCSIDVRVDPTRLRPIDVPVILGSGDRIRAELGWSPDIPLDDTLRVLLDYWRRVVAEEAAG